MKKTLFIIGAFFLFITASVNAQTDSTMPAKPSTSTDQWNNYDTSKYRLLPMPEPLTLERTFPVIGKYNVADKKSGTESSVTITLDESNKGIAWVEGLPQGKIKAMLRKAPGTYKIPAQKTEDDKSIPEGVLIFDKDNNTLDVCIGCTYNMEDPGSVFAAATDMQTDETATAEVKTKAKTSKSKSTAKTKVTPVKTWKYSGTKVVETTASVEPMQQ